MAIIEMRELLPYRWQITGALALVVLLGWFASVYRPRSDESQSLSDRARSLTREREQLLAAIAVEERAIAEGTRRPTRVAPAAAASLSPTEQLTYFLESITEPGNELDLSYFTVTPHAPVSHPGAREVPFTIVIEGSYTALADYLYQLEYQRDFVVRDLRMRRAEDGAVRADFRLSALLLEPGASPGAASPEPPDPGRPTSLELARNPFTRPPAKLAVGPDGRPYFLNVPPGLHLSGIMETNGRPVAIINHEPWGIGETIDNKRITKIDSRGVELTDDVRTYFLEMEHPPSVAGGTREANRR